MAWAPGLASLSQHKLEILSHEGKLQTLLHLIQKYAHAAYVEQISSCAEQT
jgi:hypothetical protein